MGGFVLLGKLGELANPTLHLAHDHGSGFSALSVVLLSSPHNFSSADGRSGSRRCSGDGSHQFQSPNNRIVAGIRRARTIVASRRTARAMPKPRDLISTKSSETKAPVTTTTRRAAAVTIRPLRCRPMAT